MSKRKTASHRQKTPRGKAAREKYLDEFRQQLALERFQEERPQLWLQSQRVAKLLEIQGQLQGETFTEGSCFMYAGVVGVQSFCIKQVTGIDLDTCQATFEVYGEENLEAGIVVLPLETIEWFSFPAKAAPLGGVHFQGFTHLTPRSPMTSGPNATGGSSDAKPAN
jgi:hypothetical protein